MPIPNTPNYFAIQFPMFQKAMRNILSISPESDTGLAIITTTFDGSTPGNHQYESGLIVRIKIPHGFGMEQLNGFSGPIEVVSSTQFKMDIDISTFDPFVVPAYQPGNNATPAQVVPFGEVNSSLNQATQNVLPYV